MTWRVGFGACLTAAMIATVPARACTPVPLPPPQPGETQEAYEARVAAEQREQADRWVKERQADGLQRADLIFIGRTTDWYPPYRMPRLRPGQTPPPIPIPRFEFPMPSYFKPVAWFRGGPSTDLFSLRGSNTSCGPMGFGDTLSATKGDLFVFFARKGPLSQRTMIDAIAVDAIVDPTLTAFVAEYRGKAPSPK